MADKAKTKEEAEREKALNEEAAAQQQETSMDVKEPEKEVPDHEKRRLYREKLHREIDDGDRFDLDPSVNPHNVVVRDTLVGLQVQYKTLAHTVVDQVCFDEGLGEGALQSLVDSLNKAVEDIVTHQREDMYNV